MPHDASQYLHHFDRFDMPLENKLAAIDALIHVMQGFVDFGGSANADENSLWIIPDPDSLSTSTAVESKGDHTQLFNEAASIGAEGQRP